MLNSRDMNDLDMNARVVCAHHIASCRLVGIELLITSTYRDFDAQDALYAVGRTVHPERHAVTNARAGHSWHNFKCAWDVVPIIGGKAVWNGPMWNEIIELGKKAGAEAGADWPTFKDMPHFQYRPTVEGLHINLDEAMARWNEHGSIFKT